MFMSLKFGSGTDLNVVRVVELASYIQCYMQQCIWMLFIKWKNKYGEFFPAISFPYFNC